ncbi:MAG: heterocyst formation ABC transporter subunit HepA [Cyanobacteria bacterium P01_A01_bin.45]
MKYKPIEAIYSLSNKLFKTTNFWQDNYLILREFKYFRRITVLAIVLSFLAATFEGVGISFLLSFLRNLTNPDAVATTGISWLDSWMQSHASHINPLYVVSSLILLSTWIRAGFNYFGGIYTEKVQLTLADRLRKRMFEQLQSLPLGYFTEARCGELVNTVTTEIERLKQIFGGASFIFTRVMMVAVYFATMFWLSWQLSLLSMFTFSLLAAGISTLNAKVRETSFAISEANGRLNSTTLEFINGIQTVHACATQEYERQRFHKVSRQLYSSSFRVVKAWALVKPIAESIGTTVLILLIIASVTQFTLPVSSLLTFFFVLVRMVPNIQDINGTLAFVSTLKGSLENIKELLREDNKNYFYNGNIDFYGLERSIDFVSVDFSYDSRSPVLQNIRLSIERGKMTALVGKSGSGKTTLANLIPRFYDSTEGKLLIDGVDVREFNIDSLRRKMAIVSQHTFIFNTSVRENIAYGTPQASEAEIREAAKLANALEFIEEMPEGFDTILGDRGARLSGGQQQRIAIARALLRNPDILILDEATSALDSVSERLIQDSLEKLAVGRTVIAIAHRLSTIAKADKVVVLENGRIVEQGNYQELLEQHGKLWEYHQRQHAMSS